MKAYIDFVETKDTGKTKAFNVVSRQGGDTLGEVKWFSAWRCYCFFPAVSVLFDSVCLAEINQKLTDLMSARKG